MYSTNLLHHSCSICMSLAFYFVRMMGKNLQNDSDAVVSLYEMIFESFFLHPIPVSYS